MNTTWTIVWQLFLSGMLPIAVSSVFYFLKQKDFFRNLSAKNQQIIIGVAFGICAIVGTEFGVDIGGATANARDAAPLCAGLLFGAPAGIIAGLIGGVERYFAAYWGAGTYSQLACSLSTVIAGIYAAGLRKFVFENKRPAWPFGIACGAVMEVIHMTVLFLTHLDDAAGCYRIVSICTGPMVVVSAFSVGASCWLLSLFHKEIYRSSKPFRSISRKMQIWLLVCVIFAYFFTTTFVYSLQTKISTKDSNTMLGTAVSDVKKEIVEGGTDVDISQIATHRHIGKTGYLLIADKSGTILSVSEDHAALATDGNADAVVKDHEANVLFDYQSEKVSYRCMYDETDSYIILAVLPSDEALETRNMSSYVNSYMQILVFALLFLMINHLIHQLVVENIQTVNDSLSKIIGGDLDEIVNVRSSDEFAKLSDDINSTVSSLKHYIDEEKKNAEREKARIDAELSFAQNIQHSALPSVFPAYPNIPSFDLYAMMDTAKEVGGDFYDFYMLGEDKIAFLIADVSGKGIPAAMFMMTAKTMIKNLAESALSVEEVFCHANNELCAHNDAGMFVTAWLGILDLNSGILSYVNAGHNPPLLYTKGNGYSYLRSKPGLVLAGIEGIPYRKQELRLSPGDRLFLYTDGVTEATDARKELYGEERLLAFCNAHPDLLAKELIEHTKADVDRFVGEAEQFDDITMLTFYYYGSESANQKTLEVDATLENIGTVTEFVQDYLDEYGCSMKTKTQLAVVIDEIFGNIVNYAYDGVIGKAKITTGYNEKTNELKLTFFDQGVPYNPLQKEDPDVTLSLEERSVGGLGIFMAKNMTDRMEYAYEGGNLLTVYKRIVKGI